MKYFIWSLLGLCFLYWIIPSHSEDPFPQAPISSRLGITRWNDSSYSTYFYEPEQPLVIRYTYVNDDLEQIDVRALTENGNRISDTPTAYLCKKVNAGFGGAAYPISFEDLFRSGRVIHIPIKH